MHPCSQPDLETTQACASLLSASAKLPHMVESIPATIYKTTHFLKKYVRRSSSSNNQNTYRNYVQMNLPIGSQNSDAVSPEDGFSGEQRRCKKTQVTADTQQTHGLCVRRSRKNRKPVTWALALSRVLEPGALPLGDGRRKKSIHCAYLLKSFEVSVINESKPWRDSSRQTPAFAVFTSAACRPLCETLSKGVTSSRSCGWREATAVATQAPDAWTRQWSPD